MNFVFRFPDPPESISLVNSRSESIPNPPPIPASALDTLAQIHTEARNVSNRLYNKVYHATPEHITMRLDQLEPALRCHFGQYTICIAATGSGKSMQIVSAALLDQNAITLVLSPLKLLQGSMRGWCTGARANIRTRHHAKREGAKSDE